MFRNMAATTCCAAFALSLCALVATPAAKAAVDLVLTPAVQTAAKGSVFDVELLARSDSADTQDFYTVEVLLSWDPEELTFVGYDDSVTDYPPGWWMSGFLPDPDGINDDLTDGLVLYTAWAQFGAPAGATPVGLLVSRFRFEATQYAADAQISFLPSSGTYGRTRVMLMGDITGDISSVASARVVPTTLRLELIDPQEMYRPGDTLVVHVHMHAELEVDAYEACVAFDDESLEFVSASYTTTPFPVHAGGPPAAEDGQVQFTGALETGADPVSGNALLATLECRVREELAACVFDSVFAFCVEPDSSFTLDGSPVSTVLEGSVAFDMCPYPVAACCYPDGSCAELTEVECLVGGGVWYPEWPDCDVAECPQPLGACCFHDGTCEQLLAAECTAAGGESWLMDAPCEPNPCEQPLGACCFHDGTCEQLLQAECTAAGGESWLMDAPCEPNPCEQPLGACCFHDGTCEQLLQAECYAAGGESWLMDAPCEPNPCEQPLGACCLDDETCEDVTEAECAMLGGYWEGPDTSCLHAGVCTGACCLTGGMLCLELTASYCDLLLGNWQGFGTDCTDEDDDGIADACELPLFPGDLNCDGLINAFDIDPFVLALTHVPAYYAAYPYCNHMNADINGDGLVNAFDIDPFVELLVGG